ncbi:MAG: hypothetical protein KDD25_08510, partial [Bdellovibrionales bacterium]|nr:hypothetical protein [Bdellovibrionales bacterium]
MAFVRSQNLFIFALCAGLLSCGKTNFASKPNEEVFGQVYQYSSKVDILWVVDTSDSMAVHQNHISDQFGDFI